MIVRGFITVKFNAKVQVAPIVKRQKAVFVGHGVFSGLNQVHHGFIFGQYVDILNMRLHLFKRPLFKRPADLPPFDVKRLGDDDFVGDMGDRRVIVKIVVG